MQIQVNQFLQISPDDLVSVYKDDFLKIHWEQDIEEQDLVGPNDALLLFLSAEPRWPFIRHELVLKAIGFGEMGNEFLERTLFRFHSEYQ